VFDADLLTLVEISSRTAALSAQVREGSIHPSDLEGGTFTISNLGMFGVSNFEAIINPPQAAILAVGTANLKNMVAPDGNVETRRVMSMTLSADHRIVYGADAAQFLTSIRKNLEEPSRLL
jgi:pyruvate dehydrogenase E2 component (dihydrolipoamide acetyltransferase)